MAVVTLVLAFLAATCAYVAGQAKGQLGAAWSAHPQAMVLIRTGWYSKFRHPIYLFSVLEYVLLIACVWPRWCWVPAMVLVPLQTYRAVQEERVMEEKFGDAYREYRKYTSCL